MKVKLATAMQQVSSSSRIRTRQLFTLRPEFNPLDHAVLHVYSLILW